MWNMFSRIRFNRSLVFAAVAILNAALLLTLAPAARAGDVVPDATLGGMETVLYSFGVGPTGSVCTKAVDGADPKGSLTYVAGTGLLFGRTSTTTSSGDGTDLSDRSRTAPATQSISSSPARKPTATIRATTR